MAKSLEYESEIQKKQSHHQLLELWEAHKKDDFDEAFWKKGKVLEYVVLRAFEIEGGCVSYPFDVYVPMCESYGKPIEQIDGAVHIGELHALIECKDYVDAKINIDPLAKLRNQLARRYSNVFGMFFSATAFTQPAEILVGHMGPQLFILWPNEDIEFCLKNGCFIPCM